MLFDCICCAASYLYEFNRFESLKCSLCWLSLVATKPECPGPAAHLRAQQRDGDGGGEEMSQPQFPQPLPQLEHQRQVCQVTISI